MAEEMRAHLELQAAENQQRGMSADEARYAARRAFGGVEQIKERARDERGWRWVEQTAQDLHYALRQLRKSPAFALVAILTLAIGIGANTAMFTLMNSMLLRRLPVPQPEELVVARKNPGDASFSYRSYERFRVGLTSLAGLAVAQNHTTRRWIVAPDFGGTEPEPVAAQVVSGNFFSVLGVPAVLGRALTSDDDRPEATGGAVVLSDAFWRRRFGADPAVLGKTLRLDAGLLTIVGVMPAGFNGFNPGVQPDLWWPIQLYARVDRDAAGKTSVLAGEGWEWLVLIGRLAPGATRESARAELGAAYRRELDLFAVDRLAKWTEKQRNDHFAHTLELDGAANGYASVRQRFSQPIIILMIVVGVVLLIACANIAGLLLARGAARQREFAVRTALGAGRGRLIRQLVTESVLLALLGGAGGILLAQWGTAFLGSYLPRPIANFDLAPDARVLLFTTAASVLTGFFFGLLPAWRGSHVDPSAAMKAQSAQAGVRSRLNATLVVAQLALSVALLAGAGLFVRTLRNLRAADFGFQPTHVALFSLESSTSYDNNQRVAVHRRLLDALLAAPGVRSATMASAGLMSGESFGSRFGIEGYTPAPDEEMRGQIVVVGPGFFETLGIPLLRGREFTAAEASGAADESARKVVISEKLARRFFGDADPIGRLLRHGLSTGPVFEIIGVAKDTKYRTVREQTPLEYYLPYGPGGRGFTMNFYVRTRDDPAVLAANARALVRQIDPQLGVRELRTLDAVVDDALVQERVVAQLGGFFSVFALTLASLGLYGVLSYGVAQRTREIGVRMALGARAVDVLALVVGQGLKLALIGTVLGVGLALATTRLAEKLFFGVTSGDPVTFAGVAVVLLAVATLAAWLPARRAAKVDPMVALRCE
jgi:predicted permease